MTTIANKHEELKMQLEMMTNEEMRRILDERQDMKISTRLDNYEQALKLNPLETPKVMSRRRAPHIIAQARSVKWSTVAFQNVIKEFGEEQEQSPASDASLHDSGAIASSSMREKGSKAGFSPPRRQRAAAANKPAAVSLQMQNKPAAVSLQMQNKPAAVSLQMQPLTLPPLSTLPHVCSGPVQAASAVVRPCLHFNAERLHRGTAIENIRLQLQKEQLKRIQAKLDEIKSFPGYKPPPSMTYSRADEQLQLPWKTKALLPRPDRKKPWLLPQVPRRRRQKIAVAEVLEEQVQAEEAVAAAPVKCAMELMMMGMSDQDFDDDMASDCGAALQSDNDFQRQESLVEQTENTGKLDSSRSATAVRNAAAADSGHAAEGSSARLQPQGSPDRPTTSISACSEADSIFTRDSEVALAKKAIGLSGEATHAVIMRELPVGVEFEDAFLEKVLSGEEINRIATSKSDDKPLRNGDLFLLGCFLKGAVMLVPECYQESDASSDDDCAQVVVGSRSNSRGPRSGGSNSRSRSRPSTRDGDCGFIMACSLVQVLAIHNPLFC
jgi:hypothetical protein